MTRSPRSLINNAQQTAPLGIKRHKISKARYFGIQNSAARKSCKRQYPQ
jgi:hypothetical protein